jgi:uncharacterized RDD family membrane protein YckC
MIRMTYSPNETSGTAAGYGTAATTGYASWIYRVGAYLVDALVVLPFSLLAAFLGQDSDPVTGAATLNPMYFVFIALALALNGYNRWYLAGKTGQSWGRKALGIRLVGEQTGQPIGPLMAFVRDLAHFVDSIICYIGYLFPLWDAKRQTLADKLVKTVVIR